MKIIYQEVSLDNVLQHYTKDFEPKEGSIINIDWFVDSFKNKVIFKIWVTEKEDNDKENL